MVGVEALWQLVTKCWWYKRHLDTWANQQYFDRLMSTMPWFDNTAGVCKKQELFQLCLLEMEQQAQKWGLVKMMLYCQVITISKQRKVSADEYEAIHRLSTVIWSEEDYVTICMSLGCTSWLRPQTKNLNTAHVCLQTEATLMKFFAEKLWVFCTRWPTSETAYNACSYLMFCDETLIELGYRISVIHKYAGVHSPPQKPIDKSSSDSSLSELKSKGMGKGIGKKLQGQTKRISWVFWAHQKKYCDLANKLAAERRASGKPIIEYEHVSDENDSQRWGHTRNYIIEIWKRWCQWRHTKGNSTRF